MEDLYKEFGKFNDNFIAIYEYQIHDKLSIDKNNNLVVQHPHFFRWLNRKFRRDNNKNIINYLEKHIKKYTTFLIQISNINCYNNIQNYNLLQLNHSLLNKLISGLYRLKDYYCTKNIEYAHLYIKNTQDIIEQLTNHYRKITEIIIKNSDDLNLDIYIKNK